MVKAENLTKWYGPTLAVDALSLELEPGQIVGFLGPNGAGKSTTIRMLTGYLPPTSGRATLDGHDVLTHAADARRKLGYLPESNPLYPEMRVEEYLHFAGKLHNMPRNQRRDRIGHVAERCGLSHLRRRTIGRLSKGNKQRVGLAAALLHDPPVLVLDEPTSGLDPNQISQVRQLIRDLAGEHTVLLSSHILPEVQRVADRVVIIAQGKIVADGTVDELRERSHAEDDRAPVHVEVRGTADAIKQALSGLEHVDTVEVATDPGQDGWCNAWVVPHGRKDVRVAVAEALAAQQLLVREIRREAGTLEEFFVRVTDTSRPAEPRNADAAGGSAA
ncbi:ABC transporter ATP-binding protein [Algisphaera agarilytica]|uniref:ABC-2 type transport system ATP-binding protein n=1 Tax=Algisphaera agarilytica TaxID=1385975 RepID=A0A7X0HAM2_9BACT|nr:ABC transporter ATP-binding protein [Algisphaera agarilytica]MBB6430884.1 ABC-2 type transport system ATP-binding protein [Algisphaera agarilytica]